MEMIIDTTTFSYFIFSIIKSNKIRKESDFRAHMQSQFK